MSLSNRIILFIFFLCLSIPSFGQDFDFGALNRNLATADTDTAKLNLVLKLGDLEHRFHPDTCIYYYDKVLPLCQTPDLLPYRAKLLYHKGIAVDFKGKRDPLSLYNDALKDFQTLEDTIGIARVLKSIGIYHYYRNRYDEAMTQFVKAHDLFEQVGNKPALSKILNNIAILYRVQENYDRAIEIYQQSLEIKLQLNDSLGVATTYMNMGRAFEGKDDFDNMTKTYQQALDWYEALNRPDGISFCHVAMGQSYLNKTNYEESARHFNSALPHYEKVPHHRNYGYCLQGLGKVANYNKNYRQTISLLEPALEQIKATGRKDILESMYNSLAVAKRATGAFPAAFAYLEAAKVMHDSINQEKRITLSEEMQTKFSVTQKNKDLEIADLKLAQAAQQKQLYTIGLISALFTLLLVAYFLYQKNKNNRVLAEKNSIIEQALKEKKLLVKVIEHRVDNNMQFISNLLHLQTEHLADDSAITALKESENRVAAMSLLHQNLQQQEQQADIQIAPYLSQLIDNIITTYEVDKAKIAIAKNIENLNIDVDRAIPIGLIINELLGGILKSVITKNKAGNIDISLKEKNQKIYLEVTNSDDSAIARKLPIRSFGLKLIDMLVSQLGATWNEMEDTRGRFSISMPK